MVNKYCAILSKFKLNEINMEYGILKEKFQEKITEVNDCGIDKFFCVCSNSITLLIAEALIDIKKINKNIELYVVVPYSGYELNFNNEIRNSWYYIYESADGRILLNNMYNGNDYMSTVFSEKFIMDNSDVLLIDEDKYGAIKYAESNNLNVIKLFES